MKTVILAGGLGTRISEESHLRPKPMIEIGERPMLWHIMKMYSHYQFNDFVICLGYKSQMVKEFFANYHLYESDVTLDFRSGERTLHSPHPENWRVTLVNTGLSTMTGGRIQRIRDYVANEPFFMTYGDGVADIDLNGLLKFHQSHGKLATVTAVQPGGRFGSLDIAPDAGVRGFEEKKEKDGNWINGGFFVLDPKVFDYLDQGSGADDCIFERSPMERLSADGELVAYQHLGFWQCMDTLRDKLLLDQLWKDGAARWKVW